MTARFLALLAALSLILPLALPAPVLAGHDDPSQTLVMETSKGDLAMALGLGLVLIGLSLAVNGAVYMMREVAVGTPP